MGKNVLNNDIILRSWAVLLRYYTGSELVSFIQFDQVQMSAIDGITTRSGDNAEENRASFLHYRVLDGWGLEETHVHESQLDNAIGTSNTAVHLSEDLYDSWVNNSTQGAPHVLKDSSYRSDVGLCSAFDGL